MSNEEIPKTQRIFKKKTTEKGISWNYLDDLEMGGDPTEVFDKPMVPMLPHEVKELAQKTNDSIKEVKSEQAQKKSAGKKITLFLAILGAILAFYFI